MSDVQEMKARLWNPHLNPTRELVYNQTPGPPGEMCPYGERLGQIASEVPSGLQASMTLS